MKNAIAETRSYYGGLGMPQENCVVSYKFPNIFYLSFHFTFKL